LYVGEVEDFHDSGAGCSGVIATADHMNDFIDVQNRNQQPVNQM